MKTFVCLIFLLCFVFVPAYGDLYKYVDEEGNTHYTDDPGSIPEDQQSDTQKFYEIKSEDETNSSKMLKEKDPGIPVEEDEEDVIREPDDQEKLERVEKRANLAEEREKLDQKKNALEKERKALQDEKERLDLERKKAKKKKRKYRYKEYKKDLEVYEERRKEYNEEKGKTAIEIEDFNKRMDRFSKENPQEDAP